MSLQSRLEREIESIENNDSSQEEQNREIRELERDAYDYAKEEAEESYRNTMDGYGY